MMSLHELLCVDCNAKGYLEEEDYELGCCGCLSESGECCGYPAPEPVLVQHRCPSCEGTGHTKPL